MSGVWMELKGDLELSARMVELGAKADRVVHRAATSWADHVTNAAQRRAPVNTGKLRDHISPKVTGGNAEVISEALNEHGRSYAAYVELGTGHGSAQPYLYPAFAEYRDVLPEVRAALAELVDL